VHKMSAQVIIILWKKKIVNCVTLSHVNESFLIIRKQYIKKKKKTFLYFWSGCRLFAIFLLLHQFTWYDIGIGSYHNRDSALPVYRLVLVCYTMVKYIPILCYSYLPVIPSPYWFCSRKWHRWHIDMYYTCTDTALALRYTLVRRLAIP
jgi:hypothetical protein